MLYDILGSPQSRDLGHDNLEFQVVVRNLEIDMRLVSPPDGHSENTGARSPAAQLPRQLAAFETYLMAHYDTEMFTDVQNDVELCNWEFYSREKNCSCCACSISLQQLTCDEMRTGYVITEVMNCCLKLIGLMKTTATQVHSHCQKHMLMSRNYHS